MTLSGMTGFALQEVAQEGAIWCWSLSSVQARGLELEMRLPPGCEALLPAVRAQAQAALQRGRVEIVLAAPVQAPLALPPEHAVARMLSGLAELENAARRKGITLAPADPAHLMLRAAPLAGAPQREALLGGLEAALAALARTRRAEGRGLARKIAIQLDHVRHLVREARALERDRGAQAAEQFAAAIRRVTRQASGLEPGAMEHEIAALAARGEIGGELTRIEAHAAEVEGLLEVREPPGRRLALLAEELDREAGRLRGKAQMLELARLGLDLQAAIDQLREHIDNVE
ncbi:endoribonuclease YicC domain-containing protein [Poseidonocella sp. HB161398]|uniref:endoribonuclease YicC domain-containing protein n=1 Tax=Poseidonocella sp. HB161398 TaxID=2320855 RepID=UPI001107F87B|nr:DUF1732 domain-containing protein [Poseidonocella sp. HB161398]